MPNHHPNDELLIAYASGQLTDQRGLILACHLEYCEHCRTKVQHYTQSIGTQLTQCPTTALSTHAKDSLLERLSHLEQSPLADQPKPPQQSLQTSRMPRAIQRFMPADLSHLNWHKRFTVKTAQLSVQDGTHVMELYQIQAGAKLPEHTHEGIEYTVVLSGRFFDEHSEYDKGDFIGADPSLTHQPTAHQDEDCLCLVVRDAPLKMKRFPYTLMNPFLK